MRQKYRFGLLALIVWLALIPFSALANLKVTFLEAVPGAALLQADGQAMLWGAGIEDDADELWAELNALSVEKPDLTAVPAPGTQYGLGDAKVALLSSGLALRVTYGERSFLLIQDAEAFAQAPLPGDDLKADVLAAGGPLPQTLSDKTSPLLVIGGTEPEAAATFTTDGESIQAEFTASGVTSQASVNMRKEASTKSGKAATLTKGTVLDLLGADISKEELWYKAEVSGKTGYVRGDLVSLISREEADSLLSQAAPKPKKSTGGSKSKPPADSGGGEEDPFPCH